MDTVTLTLAGGARAVRFDFDRLVAIERATGRTVLALLSEFAGYAGVSGDSAEPTLADQLAGAERFSVRTVGDFLAGCLGVPPSEIARHVQLHEVRQTFAAVLPGFVAAVSALNGAAPPASEAGGGGAAGPTPAPAASGG